MIDRPILEGEFIRYTPLADLSANIVNEELCIDIPRQNSVKASKDIHFKGKIDVLREIIGEMFMAADKVRSVFLGPIALPSEYKLSISGGEETEKFERVHICC